MATTTGIWNQAAASGQALPGTNPMDTSTGGTGSSSSSDSATISANDFLTLLVTEMQNQDPTADTDPNEYINQLVNVNSLEQLISINQTLSTDLNAPTGSSKAIPGVPGSGAAAESVGGSGGSIASQTGGATQAAHIPLPQTAAHGVSVPSLVRNAPGNLSIPQRSPAAERVAQSPGGKPHST